MFLKFRDKKPHHSILFLICGWGIRTASNGSNLFLIFGTWCFTVDMNGERWLGLFAQGHISMSSGASLFSKLVMSCLGPDFLERLTWLEWSGHLPFSFVPCFSVVILGLYLECWAQHSQNSYLAASFPKMSILKSDTETPRLFKRRYRNTKMLFLPHSVG